MSSINSEIRKPTWDTYTARDLEILSDIITLATYTSHTSQSSIEITPISFMSLFRAHDVVLSTRRIDPKTDTTYYQFLLKLSLMPGKNWCEKFENAIKDIGLKTDIEQYNWLLRQSNELSESEYSTESNISSSQLDHSSVENITFDNFIKASKDSLSFVLEHKDDNYESSVESSTKFDSQSFNDGYEKQSHIKRDIFKIEEVGKSEEDTLKGDVSIVKKNTWIPITNVVDNIKFIPDGIESVDDSEKEVPQEMEELKEKLRIYFKEWRRYFDKLISTSQNYNIIDEGTEETLVERVFEKWRSRYIHYESLNEMAEILKVVMSFRCLQKWKQLHRQRQLEIKILQEWRSWAAKTRRKRLSVQFEQTNQDLIKSNKRQFTKKIWDETYYYNNETDNWDTPYEDDDRGCYLNLDIGEFLIKSSYPNIVKLISYNAEGLVKALDDIEGAVSAYKASDGQITITDEHSSKNEYKVKLGKSLSLKILYVNKRIMKELEDK
ncbi:9577_t:CDS:10, partial [Funneliformis geosporum]